MWFIASVDIYDLRQKKKNSCLTSINGFSSDLTNIYGVLKGSISGPHLFLAYISDLLWAIKYSKVHHFVDAYIASSWNGNPKLLTVRSSSFEFENVWIIFNIKYKN